MNLFSTKNKNIGIFGLGLTGLSLYQSFADTDAEVICWDDSKENLENFTAKLGNQSLFPLTDRRWNKLDQIFISPGVPHSHNIFQIASTNNIAISSDIELFTEKNPGSQFVFITGTNGKSTVTALTGHILAYNKLDYPIGGNIGKPVMFLPQGCPGYIFELSSFQIELLNKIDPKIAVLTNVTPDHLDRYEKIEEYTKIKESILTLNALKIIGINSKISRKIFKKQLKINEIIAVSNKQFIKDGIFCNDDDLQDDFFDHQKYELPSLPHLKGLHNKENIAISYAIARALGVPGVKIVESLANFNGLEHRMQYIGSYNNIEFYNDSKATNISSALSSLSAFNNIIWFAGGRFKENSFKELEPILKNIKKAYLFGESKNLFAKFLDSKVDYEICENLEEAFNKAMEHSKNDANDLTFLLAPACASYDQFKNFAERGKLFVELVGSYKKK
jgi:UDP-N-acetylmuramoylalanine--D-glutamate ligase